MTQDEYYKVNVALMQELFAIEDMRHQSAVLNGMMLAFIMDGNLVGDDEVLVRDLLEKTASTSDRAIKKVFDAREALLDQIVVDDPSADENEV